MAAAASSWLLKVAKEEESFAMQLVAYVVEKAVAAVVAVVVVVVAVVAVVVAEAV